jgi:hypothetical protein
MSGQPTVADYIVGRLAREGITDCFGVAGDFAFELCDAVARSEAIPWIGCSNELDAAYAADGYTRVRGCSMLMTTYAVGELSALKEAILHFYGDEPQKSPDYGRIVSARHFDRLTALLASGTIYHGGQHDRADKFIAPTVLVNVSPDSPVMQEEIFGPILPVLEVENVQQVIDFVNARPSPHGLYAFAEDQHVAAQILDSTTSGDAAVNDCTIQPIIPDLPFGGVGNSGVGKYHGEWGFRTYTNARGVLYHGTRIDPDLRYPPYRSQKASRELVAS